MRHNDTTERRGRYLHTSQCWECWGGYGIPSAHTRIGIQGSGQEEQVVRVPEMSTGTIQTNAIPLAKSLRNGKRFRRQCLRGFDGEVH